jgi:hypothetical protein
VDRATPPRRRRGHDTYPEPNRLARGDRSSSDHDGLASTSTLRRLAAVGALALLLIAACASAFSMLIWEPAADPPAAAPRVVSGQSGREASATGPGVSGYSQVTFHGAEGRRRSGCGGQGRCSGESAAPTGQPLQQRVRFGPSGILWTCG